MTTIAPTSQKFVPLPTHKLGPDSHKGLFFGWVRGLFEWPQTASVRTSTAVVWSSVKRTKLFFVKNGLYHGHVLYLKECGRRERCCEFEGQGVTGREISKEYEGWILARHMVRWERGCLRHTHLFYFHPHTGWKRLKIRSSKYTL